MLKKKFGPVFKELQNFLPKNVSKSWDPGYEIRDPRSGIRDPEINLFWIPDPGPGSKRYRIPHPDPQHCYNSEGVMAVPDPVPSWNF
jgi:hypothetical protein